MFKDKFLIFIILVIALLSISVAGAAESSINETDDSTEVITSVYDENTFLDVASEDEYDNDTTFLNKSFTELNNTINSAGDINLDSNYKMADEEAINFTNGITISKNITIDGNGFTIDANHLGRIFNINGFYTVSLTNITLTNGKNSVGGAIYNEDAKLTLTDVNFINNEVSSSGGAIYTYGGVLNVINSTFVKNIGNYYNGGGIYVYDSVLNVRKSIFINNSASTYCGGGICVDSGVLNLSDSSFINNAAETGGGIYVASGDKLSVDDSSFVNNSADYGGAVYVNYDAVLSLNDSTFINNSASAYWGGAICVSNGKLSVSDSSFVNNSADYGGAVYVNYGDLTISNSTLFNNDGGAVYNYEGTAIADDNWWGNNTPAWAELVYGDGCDVTHDTYAVLSLTATDNIASINFYRNGTSDVLPISRDVNLTIGNQPCILGKIVNGTFTQNYTAPEGNYSIIASVDGEKQSIGFIDEVYVDPKGNDAWEGSSWDKAVQSIDRAMMIVSDNGRIYIADGTHIVKSRITIGKTIAIIGNGTKTFITNNKTGNGVFYVTANTVSISNCSFVNNSKDGKGGAILNYGYDFIVSNCIFVNNSAEYGGTIWNYGFAFTVDSCIFVNNSAEYDGGAIDDIASDFTVTNSVFVNNSAGRGNAIYAGDSLTANDNWWGNNTPDWTSLFDGSGKITHDTYAVLSLTASNNISYLNFYKNGTADVLKIPARSLNLTIGDKEYLTEITDGTFNKEYSAPAGDYNITAVVDNQKLAISFPNNVYVDSNGNDANTGADWKNAVKTIEHAMSIVLANGNIYLADGTHEVASQITIDKTVAIVGNGTKTLITNNKNGKGVFYVSADNVAIYNSTFTNNSADGGAAISNYGGSGLVLGGCTFINNSASCEGGAIYIEYGSSGLSVSNCTFVNNSAGEGGAISNWGSTFTVMGCTFVNNAADWNGGAISNMGSDFNMSNSVFVNNTAGNEGDAIYSSHSISADDNWWGNNTPKWDKLVNNDVDHKSYAVLNLTINSNSVTINFYKNGTAEVLKIPARSLNLTIGDKEYLTEITDGTFNKEYSAPAGDYNITAVVDNQKLAISFLNNVYVDSNGNDANTGADWKNAVKTIEHAMSIVLANGKIYLADGTHIVDSQITIDKTVAIVGNGTKTFITNNKNNNSVFKVTGNNVAIYNSTFVNNTVNDWMGIIGVWYDVSGFTVSGCSFINNSAHYGCAIYNDGSNLTVSNSTFVNNSVYYYGGAIFNYGSGFTVSDSTFVNNSANYYAGAIYNYGSDLTVSNCSFINNSAEYGSAITNWGADSIVGNSTFINNTAIGGAAIANANVNFTIKDSSFINNSGEFGVIYNDEVGTLNLNNNTYSGISEGKTYIYNDGIIIAPVTITVLGNDTVKTKPGENIILYATITCDGVNVAGGVLNFTIGGVNYIADSQKNGIYNCSYSITYFNDPKVVGASYSANKTSLKKATLVCAIETFTDLQKAIDTASEISLNSNVKMTETEANNFKNGTVISKNITINGNGFTIDANHLGRIFNITGGCTVTLNNVTLANGNHTGRGGAIHNNGTLTLNNIIFINNTALGSGAILNYGDNLTVRSCVFINNTAIGGGAIANMAYGFILMDSIFINNSAYKGGAINNLAYGFKVNNSTFINNSAEYGGAITNFGFDCIVENSSFINNTASMEGTIYNVGGGFIVNASSFVNNSAEYGGAILNWGNDSIVLDSIFINNTAGLEGGAIDNPGDNFIVNNSIFVNNSAGEYGGAIANWDVDSIVDKSMFINNAAKYGAAIAIMNSTLTVKDSIFIINSGEFGVIYNDEAGILNLSNNIYSGISEGKTYIYNNGTISSVVVTVLGNGTVKTHHGENITLYAVITCDGASVCGGILNFTIDGVNYTAESQNNGIYNCTYNVSFDNCKVVSASYDNATNVDVKTGILNARYNANLTADNVVMIYHDGTRLIANLLDANRNPIANTMIFFTINGVTYNRTTDANGSVSIAINLDYGVYNAVISYAGNETYNPASVNAYVEVKSSIISQNLVKMYQNNTQFFATFTDSNANVLANTTIRFNINGVFYTRTTDVNGTAKLNINLRPGNYTLTAYNPETGEQRGFNILVKSLIEAGDLTKYYQNESKFEAKIYNKDGSIAINKFVTFNINGVLYTRTSDENGVVKLAINLRPGNYTITTAYDGLSIANKVEVLPTLITDDLTMVYHDGSSFQAKTLDNQGMPLANQTVNFNVNGVFYQRISDENGAASLNINLMSGEYIITSKWNDFQVGNKIKIN